MLFEGGAKSGHAKLGQFVEKRLDEHSYLLAIIGLATDVFVAGRDKSGRLFRLDLVELGSEDVLACRSECQQAERGSTAKEAVLRRHLRDAPLRSGWPDEGCPDRNDRPVEDVCGRPEQLARVGLCEGQWSEPSA